MSRIVDTLISRSLAAIALAVAAVFGLGAIALAATSSDDALLSARAELKSIFEDRSDLQSLFDSESWVPLRSSRTSGIRNLEDWAMQYGWKEHDDLSWYGTPEAHAELTTLDSAAATLLPRALALREGVPVPTSMSGYAFDFSKIGAKSAFVMDAESRRVLIEKYADIPRADAGIAKLVAAATALETGLSLDAKLVMREEDEVGGVRLAVPAGTTLTVSDAVYAMLTGSANNVTSALARKVSGDRPNFTAAMNAQARLWGLTATAFVDPTGIELGSVTTAKEAAAVLVEAMSHDAVRRALTKSSYRVPDTSATVTNSNELLTDPDNGLYVYGGKLGYLRASGWSMTVEMMDLKSRKPLVISVAGADSKETLLRDVEALARWVWQTHEWKAPENVGGAVAPQVAAVEPPKTQALAPATDATHVVARAKLKEVYAKRTDLQSFFDSASWLPAKASRASKIVNLEDWASLYGYKEIDALWWYGTAQAKRILAGGPANMECKPRALAERDVSLAPTRTGSGDFSIRSVSAGSVYVADAVTRRTLVSANADAPHPVASITKLMTGLVALDRRVSLESSAALLGEDEIGGARLRVPVGTKMTVRDLMYSMLVGSANNAAHAVARVSGGDIGTFVNAMNAKARELGLANTAFADPSGLDVQNVSTAREIAALALEAFDTYEMKKMCSTTEYTFDAGGTPHTIRNTNELLTNSGNGLTVLGGKTGYLIESGWNLAVKMMDERKHPVIVVVFGADSMSNVFADARKAAEWTWGNYNW